MTSESAPTKAGRGRPGSELPVTLLIGTRNAGSLLAGCVESCLEWVSEIVVVDMESDDETLAIAESYGAHIVRVPAAGLVEPGRQPGIDAATQPWILILDVDERAAPGMRALVREYVGDAALSGVWWPRQNFLFGRWTPHSGVWPDWQMRLFRGAATQWPATVHSLPKVSGRTIRAPARIENAIIHQSLASVRDWVVALNRYTDHEADRLTLAGKRSGCFRLLAFPTARFAEHFLYRQGFRSGRYGLAIALLAACYRVLAELKLWERQGGPEGHGVPLPGELRGPATREGTHG